jgi:microsomal prostaglandin-E synthase 2
MEEASDKMIRLYQYKICPFCNKAKAAMNFLRVPYQPMEVNPLTRKEVKGVMENYTKVPIAVMPSGERFTENSIRRCRLR